MDLVLKPRKLAVEIAQMVIKQKYIIVYFRGILPSFKVITYYISL